MTSMAFRMSQMMYGKGVCNIEFIDIEVLDFLPQAYPSGIQERLNFQVLEEYGLAVRFAKVLQGHREFVLSAPRGGMVNVLCGRIPSLRTVSAKIIIDSSTAKFLAGFFNPLLSLKEGCPIASVRVEESVVSTTSMLKIYFCGKAIPAS